MDTATDIINRAERGARRVRLGAILLAVAVAAFCLFGCAAVPDSSKGIPWGETPEGHKTTLVFVDDNYFQSANLVASVYTPHGTALYFPATDTCMIFWLRRDGYLGLARDGGAEHEKKHCDLAALGIPYAAHHDARGRWLWTIIDHKAVPLDADGSFAAGGRE